MSREEFNPATEQSASGRTIDRRAMLRQATGLVAAAAIAGRLAPAGAQNRPGGPARLYPEGFTAHQVETSGGVVINLVKGGEGPPVLLLHGAPQSHITWRNVAPGLAANHTVIAADLRGYGDSGKPEGLPDHSNYSKRAMAQDQVEVMRHFGFERFDLIGQDRGGRVAHRLALDHPEAVTRLAVLDIVPTYYLYTNVTLGFVQSYYHWFSYLRRSPIPENEILAQRQVQADRNLNEVQAEYMRNNILPETIHGMCEDYRAGASIDLEHDRADLDNKIACPLLVLWAQNGAMERLYDVMAIWNERGVEVSGKGMPGGHNMQEGAPQEVLAELQAFLRT